jgi:selenocysteine lyase/cysteine desulfurase
MGERANFALMPAAIAAMRRILDWGVPAIEATLAARTASIAGQARSLGLSPMADDRRGPHYLGIALPDTAPPDLLQQLAARQVHVSRRGRSLRVTPHLYNDEADTAQFIASLKALL